MRWLFFIVTGAALLAVAAVVVVVSRPSVDDLRVSVESCAVAGSSVDVRGCLETRLGLVVESGLFEEVAPSLGRLSDSVPDFRGKCHLATHALGRQAWEAHGDDLDGLMRAVSPRVCGDGLVHAVMEFHAATSSASLDSWRALAAACAHYLRVDGSRGDGCSHGLGHGLYIFESARGGVPAALELCTAVLGDRDPSELAIYQYLATGCGYGVMMAAFVDGGKELKLLEDTSVLLPHCDAIAPGSPGFLPGTVSESLYRGCMVGTGFAFGSHVAALPEGQRRVELATLVALCELGRDPLSLGARVCVDQTIQQAIPAVMSSPASVHELCSLLSEGLPRSVRISCLAQARNSVTADVFEDILNFDASLRDDIEKASAEFAG